MTRWLSVIGIGDGGLSSLAPIARARLDAAEIVGGGARHLAMLPDDGRRRIAWPTPLSHAFDEIAALAPRQVAVLASGDPLWFGVGNTLARRFGPDDLAMFPAPSAFSLAASRLLWPLGDVDCITLHGRADAPFERHIAPGNRILVLSRDGTTPAGVAARLAARGFGPSTLTVLEHMGGPSERLRTATADQFALDDIADLNTVAVVCRPGPVANLVPATPGLNDAHFLNDGQITCREVRAVTLARLMPLPDQTLWDVGAGSGAIAIEWLRATSRARAYAIESVEDRIGNIHHNAEAMGVPHIKVVHGSAPEALADLSDPDAIFVGGGLAKSGVTMIDACMKRLRPGGRLVANAVTLASEGALANAHTSHGGDLTRIAISPAAPVGPHWGWKPHMPVTQWAWQKSWEAVA